MRSSWPVEGLAELMASLRGVVNWRGVGVFNFSLICGCLFALNSNVTGSTVLTRV